MSVPRPRAGLPVSTDSSGAVPDTQPPDGKLHSLWRLRSYLRPHTTTLAIMLTVSLVGVGLAIAIPLVTRAIIDGAP